MTPRPTKPPAALLAWYVSFAGVTKLHLRENQGARGTRWLVAHHGIEDPSRTGEALKHEALRRGADYDVLAGAEAVADG